MIRGGSLRAVAPTPAILNSPRGIMTTKTKIKKPLDATPVATLTAADAPILRALAKEMQARAPRKPPVAK